MHLGESNLQSWLRLLLKQKPWRASQDHKPPRPSKNPRRPRLRRRDDGVPSRDDGGVHGRAGSRRDVDVDAGASGYVLLSVVLTPRSFPAPSSWSVSFSFSCVRR